MKVEFDLNSMGIVYLFIAVGLVASAVLALGTSIPSLERNHDLFSIFLSILILSVGIVAVGLLVPVVRRLFKAFMPSA
jgi:hypothetical protein